jgi:sensor histidine kinase regulating citrate/malate metabolism
MKNEISKIRELTAILDAMEDGMYIISDNYTIDFMNKAIEILEWASERNATR